MRSMLSVPLVLHFHQHSLCGIMKYLPLRLLMREEKDKRTNGRRRENDMIEKCNSRVEGEEE